MAVIEVTSREFRERQKSYFDLADKGEKVILKRGKKQAYVLVPLSEDDLFFTPQMLKKIDQAVEQIKEGKGIVVNNREELEKLLDSL